jgi:hypothetical protein
MHNIHNHTDNTISCQISNSVLMYLESQGFDTDEAIAGLPYTKDYLKNAYNWITSDDMKTVSERAAQLTNDPAIMYRVGFSST